MLKPLLAATVLLAFPVAVRAQQPGPAGTGGMALLDRTLSHLATNKRVLLVGAHPDDEDNEFLTLLSRGMGVDAAYLSLSRGEGGQNLIGPELGEGLGLLRTGELLAARSIDGGRQYFTRGFDFGFSRSLAETLESWPHDSILTDVLRVIRRFRPQVLVAVFGGTARDGHGQHQMSGVMAREAFELLRDSAWGPVKLYRMARFDPSITTLSIPSGQLEPVEGRSILQLAMEGRSLHRSQDMGQLQRLGASRVRLSLQATRSGAGRGGDDDLFAGVDTTLPSGLERYASLVDSARAVVGPRGMRRAVPLLAAALAELRGRAPAEFRAMREADLEEALAAAAGVVVDAFADDASLSPGESLNVAVATWDAGGSGALTREVSLVTPAGWTSRPVRTPQPGEPDPLRAAFQSTTGVELHRFAVAVPPQARPTTPYFLARPRRGALYDWDAVPDSLRGEPLDPPAAVAIVRLEVAGQSLTLEREVTHRFGDQARGEVRRPLAVVPRVGVSVTPRVMVWPVAETAPRTVTVELTHGASGATRGEVGIELPDGWPPVPPQRFALDGEDTRRSYGFSVRPPAPLRPGSYRLRAYATYPGGRDEIEGVTIDYPHVRPVAYVSRATAGVEAADLRLPDVARVGYVRGASDLVPEALTALGLPLTLLGPAELERSDLGAYDVIVVGSRAYETDPALVASNGRLLDYVRGGGRLIVQYQQYAFVDGGFAPFPLTIGRPHDRVTDETAPVRLLEPGHRLFAHPNRIGPADFDGWVQERGLYFARQWDPAYRPLLESGDDGEALRGGLLVARLGSGLYVYTGLAFFRQLPAGVPGASRLFLNLLALEPGSAL